MRRASLFIIFSVLVLVDGAWGNFGWRGGGSYESNSKPEVQKSSYIEQSSDYSSRYKISNSPDSKSQATSRSLGISAWGIIGIIVGAILLTTTAYYAFVLYPYVCKKQRSYDMIELTDVV